MGYTRSDPRVAYFVTPHGYGHAARASAVMGGLLQRQPDVRFDVFTQVPAWFFEPSVRGAFEYHDLMTDIGLVQRTALSEDLSETTRRLDELLPFDPVCVTGLAEHLRRIDCRLVVCDISPLGIAVARAAGIPSVLIENFTWDWIYAGYAAQDKRLCKHIEYLEALFDQANHRIQTQPVSRRVAGCLATAPVSRAVSMPASVVRERLGVPENVYLVLVTMGGFSWQYRFLKSLPVRSDIYFVVPGADHAGLRSRSEHGRNVVCLPHRSGFFHPDLVNASDVVIGKVGYSTVAEVYWSGCAYGYVPRENFRESDSLVEFVQREIPGLPISPTDFDTGLWVNKLPDLLALPRTERVGRNGAEQVAEFVGDLLTA